MNEIQSSESQYMDIAHRMELLHLGDSAGVVYWKPAGLKLYEKLRSYVRDVHERHGYEEVKTPALVGLPVFEKSGHLGKYRENMFLANQVNDPEVAPDLMQYALRPMSCPNHIELYSSSRRSYRELPLALFEFGEVYRNEPSGSLQVLFRQRQFCQDDSHVFVAENQVIDSVCNYLKMALVVYAELGFKDVEVAISLRPEQRYGSDELWDRTEEGCREACRKAGLSWQEQPGGGAFYGPKIELGVRDKRGRLWQMGVIQLDSVLPERFELKFVNEQGAFERPVVLHHAVLGSLERMIGTLLETHGVDLPAMLHPYPLVLVPVSQDQLEYSKKVGQVLKARGHANHVELSQEPLSAKVREWKIKGAQKIVVIGAKEVSNYASPEVFANSL